MGQFSEKLKGMKKTWTDSSAEYDRVFGGVKVDAGQYVARLQSAKIRESNTSGNMYIRREHVILEGQFQGMIVPDNMNLMTAQSMSFVRRYIDQMGYECPPADKPEELEDVLAAIVQEGPTCKIAVKHSGDFTNVSIIEVLQPAGGEQAPAGDAGASDTSDAGAEAEQPRAQKSTPKGTPSAEDKLADKLFDFCKAQDITTETDDTVDVLKERIREYSFPEKELTDEEKELFKEAGIEDVIERVKPEPPKKEPARKPMSKKKKK
jgi:ribosomal protein L12E/L44/L45/RPP1/RPP2